MSMAINSNIGSLNAQRHLHRSGKSLSRAFERLSSGFRINSAADDAAGLAISSRMGAQIRSLNTAIRNTNDGISLVQTAEASMSETSNILERMRELAVQAVNDTNTLTDRLSLQDEIDQLSEEIDRIGNNTEYNTAKLFDGTGGSKTIQVGAQAEQTISVQFHDMRTTALGAVATQSSTNAAGVGAAAITAGDLAIKTWLDDGTTTSYAIDVSDADDDTVSVDAGADNVWDNADDNAQRVASAIAKATAINKTSSKHKVVATVEANVQTADTGTIAGGNLLAGGLNINNVDIGAVDDIQANDSSGILQAAINSKSASTGVTATVSSGKLVLTAADGRNINVTETAAGEVIVQFHTDCDADAGGAEFYADITLTSNYKFQVSGTETVIGFANNETVSIGDNGGDPLDGISVATVADANTAMTRIDRAIDQVSQRRGDLGSLQNRFESTVANLQALTENLSAARSRIRDADFAQETAELTRAQIVQEAGVAILAQANASPQLALALLA